MSILKNNMVRLIAKGQYLIISFVLTIAAISLAIYFNGSFSVKAKIGLINESNQEIAIDSQSVKVTKLTKPPVESTLLLGRYDAIVTIDKNNEIKVKTIKDSEFKKMIIALCHNQVDKDYKVPSPRGLGANILGFLTMFLLLQGTLYMLLFADDREQKQIVRIATSPISFTKYLFSHFLFTFLMILLPSLGVLVVARVVLSVSIGFTLLEFLGLLSIISIFSTAFAIFLNSFFTIADTANMIGSSVILLTSILGGCFAAIENNNKIFQNLVKVLPQNSFIGFAEALEKHTLKTSNYIGLIYVIVLSVILFGIAIYRNRKDYIAKMN